ncbi:NIF-domain-containing protein [Rhodofomes roseus]|uniref:NIF-domain-containing protein n=1 Tax=Rhodofomes roseus TaxID=34475 RepID=A0ABQ8L077_9APHY|nr:NIF-domain-containing protein [Rhodofomes roseus]KAH9844130.1 NIF-domain-containing protein [Rhodofomes roseus]
MNSLTYLSRQFDVLASPRAPPSTPVSESPPSLSAAGDRQQETRLPRVRTWSTKSFRVPLPGSPSGPWTLRRSLSSPAVASPDQPVQFRLRRPSSSSKQPSRPPSRRPSVSSTEKAAPPIDGVIHSIFLLGFFLLLWHYICAAWRTITRQRQARVADEVAVEDGSDEDEKDTEDESKDVKPVLLRQPTFPPAIPPPLSQPPPPPSSSISAESSTTAAGLSPSEIPIPPATNPEVPVRAVPATHTGTSSRASTPSGVAHKTPFHLPKTLVLDLDETLIHSTSRPMMSASSGTGFLGLSIFGHSNKGAGHVVEVMLGGRSTLYHVYKRPFVDYFLRKVSTWYTLVIFTASMQEYADPVIDWLDAGRGILTRRLFRESCTQLPNGSYSKDLSIVEADLARVCLIDNSPVCYSINEANGIPIEGWTHDPHDEALLDLLPVLDSLRFTSDVRHVLGIRGFS